MTDSLFFATIRLVAVFCVFVFGAVALLAGWAGGL